MATTSKKKRFSVEKARREAPLLAPDDTAREGMLLVNRILNPSKKDEAAPALIGLVSIIGNENDAGERTNIAFYCTVQCVFYLKNHREVLDAITAKVLEIHARKQGKDLNK